jgi:uncharacterized membrane protein YfcA
MEKKMDIEVALTIIAGGMFGVVLGKFLQAAPDWVFWLVFATLFVVVLYLLSAG